jgi:hypothetical protein
MIVGGTNCHGMPGLLYIQPFFVLFLLVLSFFRIQSLGRSNRDFPSRWHTTSDFSIILTNSLVIGYKACLIASGVLNVCIRNIANGPSVPANSSLITQDTYTLNQKIIIANYSYALHKVS